MKRQLVSDGDGTRDGAPTFPNIIKWRNIISSTRVHLSVFAMCADTRLLCLGVNNHTLA